MIVALALLHEARERLAFLLAQQALLRHLIGDALAEERRVVGGRLVVRVGDLAALVERAVDESLRWNATDPIFPRLTTRDIEVDGVLIPEGSRVDICLGAANRDPTRWDNPDQFDIFRPKQAHLGFAIGEHQCLGMNVAKQEMIVSLNGLMDRFPNMHLDPDLPAPQLIGGLEQRGMSSIPVVFA